MFTSEELRDIAERELEQGDTAMALEHLRDLWRSKPTAATAGFILNCRARHRENWPVSRCRVVILRSFTVEPLVPLLKAIGLLEGLELSIEVGMFNAYQQELLGTTSTLYQAQPDVLILAIQTRDFVSDLWDSFSGLDAKAASQIVTEALDQIGAWVRAFRKQSTAQLIVHNFELPMVVAQGILDGQMEMSQRASIQSLNEGLRLLARSFEGVSILDYDGLVSFHGRFHWFDAPKWATAGFPISASCVPFLPQEWLRFIYAVAGPVKKVLVTDLDNTLWGGLAGEDGLDGIRLGTAPMEAGFRELQAAILDLYHRGILLAICSKNNEVDAIRILENHPGMLLRPQHFSALRINWQDKAQNLREIAAELNVGLDSLVFMDDNPAERRLVRMEIPEVTVIELPEDSSSFARALRERVCFDRLTITEEDRVRQLQYQDQRRRVELSRAATTLEEFYWSLGQVVTLSPLQPETIARASQLTRKTNQFNVTTKQYGEESMRSVAETPGWSIWTVNVADRFGDNGLVGILITHTEREVCEIDTLLLSCRVIGRKIESAILAHLLAESRRQELSEVCGKFKPTNKNQAASRVFEEHGFTEGGRDGTATNWVFDLKSPLPTCPPWIEWRMARPTVVEACATP